MQKVFAPNQTVGGIRRLRNILIPLDDGVELAASLYLPNTPGEYPTLISFTPYHKDDYNGASNEASRTYFAERGYASLSVDFRGTGGSTGAHPDSVLADMDKLGCDAAQVVEWAATQEWCDGEVAVWGLSWGGSIPLAVAAQRPPHLTAIATIHTCSDVYLESWLVGGCRAVFEVEWASWMLAMDLAPPALQDPEGRWMRVWRERLGRLERGELWKLNYRRHDDYDEHWARMSIPTEQIEVPTFVISGWRDKFAQAMPEAYVRVAGPKKLLMGPWGHDFPEMAGHAPIDLPHELLRFFNYWLKGEENDVADEPPITIFIQGAERWRHEREWPIARTLVQDWHLQAGRTLGQAPDAGSDTYRADPTVGCADPTLGLSLVMDGPYPSGQAADDVRSLTYTSAPLEQGIEITGSPDVTLQVALEEGNELQLVAKLSAVAPDGRSTVMTTGQLSATHRESLKCSQPVERGVVAEYRIQLFATSFFVPEGHRLRLAISCGDFPRIWPTRTNSTMRVELADSFLRVPVVPEAAEPLGAPELLTPDPTIDRAPWGVRNRPLMQKVERDAIAGTVAVEVAEITDLRTPNGVRFQQRKVRRAITSASRPDAAAAHSDVSIDVDLPGGEHVEVRTRGRGTRETMLLNGEVTLDGVRLFSGVWRQPDI